MYVQRPRVSSASDDAELLNNQVASVLDKVFEKWDEAA